MSDKFRIDSHKLIYHPLWVADFLKGYDHWDNVRSMYPIYVELSPVGVCNYRCKFCAYDYVGYKGGAMDGAAMISLLKEMASLGVKSIHLAGEGEPLLHKQIVEAINSGYEAGLDFGITTNGSRISDRFIQEALHQVTWMKVSINAGTAEDYERIHRCGAGGFSKVIDNLARSVKWKRSHGLQTTIGAQSLLLPDNVDGMEALARICRDEIGLDYLVIKPYSQHMGSSTKEYENIDYSEYLYLEDVLTAYSTEDFQVIFRANTMKKYSQSIGERYNTCYSIPFLQAHIMTSGELCSCPSYLEDPRFSLGNVFESGFKEVWESEKRRENWEFVRHGLDVSECRRNCHMDHINVYLADLVEKRVPHVNFI